MLKTVPELVAEARTELRCVDACGFVRVGVPLRERPAVVRIEPSPALQLDEVLVCHPAVQGPVECLRDIQRVVAVRQSRERGFDPRPLEHLPHRTSEAAPDAQHSVLGPDTEWRRVFDAERRAIEACGAEHRAARQAQRVPPEEAHADPSGLIRLNCSVSRGIPAGVGRTPCRLRSLTRNASIAFAR